MPQDFDNFSFRFFAASTIRCQFHYYFMSGDCTLGTLSRNKDIHIDPWIVRADKTKIFAFFKCSNNRFQSVFHNFYYFSFPTFSTGRKQCNLHYIILDRTIRAALRNKNIFRLTLDGDKAKATGMSRKDTGKIRTCSLRIFSFR